MWVICKPIWYAKFLFTLAFCCNTKHVYFDKHLSWNTIEWNLPKDIFSFNHCLYESLLQNDIYLYLETYFSYIYSFLYKTNMYTFLYLIHAPMFETNAVKIKYQWYNFFFCKWAGTTNIIYHLLQRKIKNNKKVQAIHLAMSIKPHFANF